MQGRADVGSSTFLLHIFQTADLCPLQQFIETTILFYIPRPIAVMVSLPICCIPVPDGSSKTLERNLVEVELGILYKQRELKGSCQCQSTRVKSSENKKESIKQEWLLFLLPERWGNCILYSQLGNEFLRQ